MFDENLIARSPIEKTDVASPEEISRDIQEVLNATPNIHQDRDWPDWKKDQWIFGYPHHCFGEITLGAINSIDEDPDPTRAYIVYVEVPQKYRQHGIATKIVTDMIAFAQANGKTNITFKPTSTEGSLLADSILKKQQKT